MHYKKPLILAGHGVRVSGSYEGFHQWISKLNIPVITTQMASDLMPWDHPLYVGHPGVKGDRAGNLAVQNCDALFIIGCSMHPSTTGYNADQFAPNAEKMHLSLPSDWPVFYHEMSENWLKQCQTWKETLMVRDEPHDRTGGVLNYYDVIEGLSQACLGDETIVVDSGLSYYLTGQAFRIKKGQRFIAPGALAQMGYALPATTGACFGAPGRTVIGIVGDGGFQLNVHELAVISHHQLNAKILVINNDGYACIRNTQKNYFDSFYSGTDRQTGVMLPDVQKISQAYEIPYMVETLASGLQETLRTFLVHPGPVILEIYTTRNQEFMPVVKSFRLPNGEMASGALESMYPPLDQGHDPSHNLT